MKLFFSVKIPPNQQIFHESKHLFDHCSVPRCPHQEKDMSCCYIEDKLRHVLQHFIQVVLKETKINHFSQLWDDKSLNPFHPMAHSVVKYMLHCVPIECQANPFMWHFILNGGTERWLRDLEWLPKITTYFSHFANTSVGYIIISVGTHSVFVP